MNGYNSDLGYFGELVCLRKAYLVTYTCMAAKLTTEHYGEEYT